MFVLLLEKINQCAARARAFLCNAGFLLMAALVWTLSAWRVILLGGGGAFAVFWIWSLAGGFAAVMAALAFLLVGALLLLANYFRL